MYKSFVLSQLSYGIIDMHLGKRYRKDDDKEKMVEVKGINRFIRFFIWFFLLYMMNILFRIIELLEYFG